MMRPIIFQVAPPAPTNFVAVLDAVVPGQVSVSWTDTSASESGFNLQRDTDPAFSAPVNLLTNGSASTPSSLYGGVIAYTDTTAPTGVPVYYWVQAEDDFLPYSPLSTAFQVVPMFSAWVNTTLAQLATTTTIAAPAITYGQAGVVTVKRHFHTKCGRQCHTERGWRCTTYPTACEWLDHL